MIRASERSPKEGKRVAARHPYGVLKKFRKQKENRLMTINFYQETFCAPVDILATKGNKIIKTDA